MEVGSSSLPGTTHRPQGQCDSGQVPGTTHRQDDRYNATLNYGGLAQLARAPALQAGGQRFESVILHNPLQRETIFDILIQAKL